MSKIVIIVLGLFLLYIWMIVPGRKRKTERDYFSSWNYAHRGFYNNKMGMPENSLPAFCRAVSEGYGIELDIQMTRDKQLVVFHDDTLSRVCGLNSRIKDFDYQELCQLRLFDSEEPIPLLAQVLSAVDGKVPLLIEIKLMNTDTSICHYADMLLRAYPGRYCIESFNPLVLFWYRCHHRQVFRGQLSGNLLKEPGNSFLIHFTITNLLLNFLVRPDFVAYRYQDRNNISLQIVQRFFKAMVLAWTVDSQKAYDECKNHFDAVIFEGFDLNRKET